MYKWYLLFLGGKNTLFFYHTYNMWYDVIDIYSNIFIKKYLQYYILRLSIFIFDEKCGYVISL